MEKDIILDFRKCPKEKIEEFLELTKDNFSNSEWLSNRLKLSWDFVGITIFKDSINSSYEWALVSKLKMASIDENFKETFTEVYKESENLLKIKMSEIADMKEFLEFLSNLMGISYKTLYIN